MGQLQENLTGAQHNGILLPHAVGSKYLSFALFLFPSLPKRNLSAWDAVHKVRTTGILGTLEQIRPFKKTPLHLIVPKEAGRSKTSLWVGYSWIHHSIWQSSVQFAKPLAGRRKGWKSLGEGSKMTSQTVSHCKFPVNNPLCRGRAWARAVYEPRCSSSCHVSGFYSLPPNEYRTWKTLRVGFEM